MVGPYCVFDDFKPLPLSPRPDHQTLAETPADKEKMDDSLLSSEYPLNMSLAAASPDNFGPSGNWEEWMKWDPSSQNQSPKALNVQGPLCYLKPGQQRSPLYDRRQNSQLRDASLGLPANAIPSSRSMPMRANNTPFTFGETADHTPAFHFDSGALSSPSVADAAPNNGYFNAPTVWDQAHQLEQNDNPIFSPLGYEQPQLHAIAIPPHSTPSLQHSPSSATNMHTSSSSSQSSPEPAPPRSDKKRKSATEDDLMDQKTLKQPPVKKTAHNMIEKRYRTNLNDKIAALRDSVPSLRAMSRGNGHGDEEDDPEDLEGLTPAHKLNKATVLSKATEYIRHLEKRNKRLSDELAMLKSRMDAFDKLSMSGPMTMAGAVNTPDGIRFQDDPFATTGPQVSGPPQGLIPVPDSMANLHRGMSNQPHYAPHPTGYPMYSTSTSRPTIPGQPIVNGRRNNNGLMGKLMVGSLAGLMIMEGLGEREQSDENPAGRGLFALPFNVVNILTPRVSFGGVSTHLTLLPFVKLLLVLGAIFYLIAPLFEFKSKAKKKMHGAIKLSPAPSLASPVEVRRKAWLTAIQTVWVPRHSFLLEVAALGLKTLKLSTRKIIGWQGYAVLTGITKEQETARIRAWEIALDAQLTGGDAEISMSRLVLTLMASGTLPDTPARLMLKALHIRVLLWEVANAGYGTWYMFEELSAKLARTYWNAARYEHKMMAASRLKDGSEVERLPDHLAALLEMESDDVLVDTIIQRAYNLAWNKPSADKTTIDESMDSVVEDFSISSPLDALAAWWSSLVLNRALISSLASNSPTIKEGVKHDLGLANLTAPPMSCAQLRALVANAVLLDDDRSNHINAAVKALPSPPSPPSLSRTGDLASPPRVPLINLIGNAPIAEDVKKALTLAKCLSLVEEENMAKNAESRPRATFVVNNGYFPAASMTLLSLTAALKVLDVFLHERNLCAESKNGLERIAQSMRIWVGFETGCRSGLQSKTRCKIIDKCLDASKMLVGMSGNDEEIDAGYVSQSDTGSVTE